ncbi:213_t:CDS:2 [Diversispora eburnea]|uniref:213_t:CDS:1 n=1 Tax=Diversispora eburnea TaxID=1213867 RepID=A0A9N9B1W5_9GLOM|nr:213_t:CDS:2 [Diversispora eburnea]
MIRCSFGFPFGLGLEFRGKKLSASLKRTDVIVSALSAQGTGGNFYSDQLPFLKAAKEVGVKRFILSELVVNILNSTSLTDIGKYAVESLKLPEARNATIKVAVVEDREVRNKIEPIPSITDDFRVFIFENATLSKLDFLMNKLTS